MKNKQGDKMKQYKFLTESSQAVIIYHDKDLTLEFMKAKNQDHKFLQITDCKTGYVTTFVTSKIIAIQLDQL